MAHKTVWGLLFVAVVLVWLRLAGVIDWSWWWVTVPLWAAPALLAGTVLVVWVVGKVARVAGGLDG